MKLEKFKEVDKKKTGIIVFTITCILLTTGVILYRTFAVFETNNTLNVINGSIEDVGDIYFAFYVDGVIQKDMPQEYSGYILDEEKSFCGILGKNNETIKPTLDPVDWSIKIKGMTTSRTKCNLYFKKGAYILGNEVPIVTEGDGLYEVKHENISGTVDDIAFSRTEYHYAGTNINNYVIFNNEIWRIIGLVNVITASNKVEQRIKIIQTTNEVTVPYNTVKDNTWENSNLQKELNGNILNKLDFSSQEKIDNKIKWSIGLAPSYGSYPTGLTENFYKSEHQINSETATDKIALLYPSDYGYAVGGEYRENCLNKILNKWNDDMICNTYNWLYTKGKIQWTLMNSSNKEVSMIINHGYVNAAYVTDEYIYAMPTLYLKKAVKIISGIGSSKEPYKLNEPYT